jgi:hypothetical protein
MNFKIIHLIALFLSLLLLPLAASAAPVDSADPSAKVTSMDEKNTETPDTFWADRRAELEVRKPLEPAAPSPPASFGWSSLGELDALIYIFIKVLLYMSLYMSIPVAIRYVVLRRPIENKWVAIAILAPIFIGFSVLINVQREDFRRKSSEQFGLPYKSRCSDLQYFTGL